VPASLVLVGGEPGIGKSTLLLARAARDRRRAPRPARPRARSQWPGRAQGRASGRRRQDRDSGRDGAGSGLRDAGARAPRGLRDRFGADAIIHRKLGSAPGSVAPGPARQLRGCSAWPRRTASRVPRRARDQGRRLWPGRALLEHAGRLRAAVRRATATDEHRILRATKNRFGSTNELGVLRDDLRRSDRKSPMPRRCFGRSGARRGRLAAVACTLEGSRPILLEIQALVARSEFGHAAPSRHRVSIRSAWR